MASPAGGSRRSAPGGRASAWFGLGLALILSLVLVLTPVGLIQPFQAQTESGVHLAYVLRSWSPPATLTLLLAGLLSAAMLLRRLRRWWGRAAALLLVGVLAASAWLARQNHFEWMFHPIDEARFAGTDAA